MDTGLTATELADFTGQPVDYYGTYASQALSQAGDLFELATGLAVLPSDPPLMVRTARYGVLAMAEMIYEGQTYRSLRFSPFKSQQIGSYNYTLAENAVLQGIPTGVSWFDLAVRLLSTEPEFTAYSVRVFDRPHDLRIGCDGQPYLPGPADLSRIETPYGWSGVPEDGFLLPPGER